MCMYMYVPAAKADLLGGVQQGGRPLGAGALGLRLSRST